MLRPRGATLSTNTTETKNKFHVEKGLISGIKKSGIFYLFIISKKNRSGVHYHLNIAAKWIKPHSQEDI